MKKVFLIVLISGIVFSCNDRLGDMNKPTKNAGSVPADKLFTNGLREMFDLMASTDVNSNVFRLYSQYWAQTTYPDESQYNMVTRQNPDNIWTFAYRDVLKDLDQSKTILLETYVSLGMSEAQKNNQIAIIDACKAYMFTVLVDAFSAVPFTEALKESILSPKYDPGADVYNASIAMLDGAIAGMTVSAPGFSAAQDPIYEGDVAKWKKFANSLKLRLAVTISDVNAAKAATMISEAISGGLISSNADNTSITYLAAAPNTNPVWEDLVQSGRADYVVANTFIDKLKSLSDPRIAVFAEKKKDGTYVGGKYGSGNAYDDFSHIGDLFHEPTLEGLILDYSEVEFLLAEAAAKGLVVPGSVESHYNAGIKASMEYWGIEDADIAAYLLEPGVAYATAAGDWKQKIGVQQWIAFYNRGFEGWNTWRRLDFTGFNVPEGLTAADIPKRMIFPLEEATLNPTNLKSAVQLIGGSDDVKTRVFWDVK